MVVVCVQVCPVPCTYKWHCGEVRLAISGSEYQALVYFFAEPRPLEVFDMRVLSQGRFGPSALFIWLFIFHPPLIVARIPFGSIR